VQSHPAVKGTPRRRDVERFGQRSCSRGQSCGVCVFSDLRLGLECLRQMTWWSGSQLFAQHHPRARTHADAHAQSPHFSCVCILLLILPYALASIRQFPETSLLEPGRCEETLAYKHVGLHIIFAMCPCGTNRLIRFENVDGDSRAQLQCLVGLQTLPPGY
jgi:hypothetical protein